MKMLLEAIQFAGEKHSGQFRRGSDTPYVAHTIAVSYLVAAYKSKSKKLEELVVAAVLHDCIEDTDTTLEELATRFTPLVASLVQELSNDKVKVAQMGKLEYQTEKLLNMSNYALTIKLADRLHNISDAPTLKMVKNTQELMRRLKQGRHLTAPQLGLVAEIEATCEQVLASREN